MMYSYTVRWNVQPAGAIAGFVRASCVLLACAGLIANVSGQSEMKRMRGEPFYRCISSNTPGSGNIWISLTSVGHVWDDVPARTDGAGAEREGFWMFNARVFPEARVSAGLFNVAALAIESRPLTWDFKMPGWVAGDLKLTWPNNKDLRLLGFGCSTRYLYGFTNTTPTLGGYVGFMPEGYVTKGGVFEGRFLFDVDLTPKITVLPLRFLLNCGVRLPLENEYTKNYQFLSDVGFAYSGYGYDFFAAYSVEAFNNFTGPKTFTQGTKKFIVWFSENPMYLVLGGNVRYKNGITLSVALPLLTSVNVGSKMDPEDLAALNRNRADLFPYEVAHGIKDPFDPWFVKWKIIGSITFPLWYKMTSAEMMRNFLLLKNTKERNRIDIDNRLRSFEQSTNVEPEDDTEKRLEEIRTRKEEMRKQEE